MSRFFRCTAFAPAFAPAFAGPFLPCMALLGAICLASLGTSQAEEPHHFSAGLKQLAELGIPEMKGAEWIEYKGDERHPELYKAQHLQNLEIQLKGNVWKLDTHPPSYLGLAGITPFQLGSDNASSSEGEDAKPSLRDRILTYAKENDLEGKQPAAEANPRTLAQRDASRISKRLLTPSTARQMNERMQWGGNNGVEGHILLFATQLLLAGEEEAANDIAEALFGAIDDDIVVINSAINILAEAEYQQITQNFFENGDWQAYLTGLKTILRKYTRGWENRAAVDLLASRVANRTPAPVPTSIDGIDIDPKARELVGQLLQRPPKMNEEELLRLYAIEYGMDPSDLGEAEKQAIIRSIQMNGGGSHYSSSSGLWLLQDLEVGSDRSAMEQLKAMGMKALPALASMTADDTLTQQPNQDSNSHYGMGFSSGGNLQQAYDNLYRPTSRGELVSNLLIGVLPIQSDSYDGSTPNPAILRDMALDLYRKHKDSSKEELAFFYFQQGSNHIQMQAASHLTQSEDPAIRQKFEQTILNHADILAMLSIVEHYIETHKSDAKPLARSYIQKLKAANPSEQDLQQSHSGYQIIHAGGIDKYCNQLSLRVGDISLDKLIQQALAEDTGEDTDSNERSPILSLGENLEDMGLVESMGLFVKYADKAKPEQWKEIITVLVYRAQYEAMMEAQAEYMRENGQPQEAPAEQEALNPELIQAWGKLRERDDPISDSDETLNSLGMIGCRTVGDVTTLLIDFSTRDVGMTEIYKIAMLTTDGEHVIKHSNKRVNALLKGQKPEAWPDAEALSEQRREEILAKLAGLPAAELTAYANSLNLDERMVVMDYCTIERMDEQLPANVIELNRTLVSTVPMLDSQHDPEMIRELGVQEGQQINEEFLVGIADKLLERSKTISPTIMVINRGAMGLGSTIQAITPKVDKEGTSGWQNYVRHMSMVFEYDDADLDAIVVLSVGQHQFLRTLKDGKPVWTQSPMIGRGQDADLKQALEGEHTFARPIVIFVTTREKASRDF